jgi:cellulose synthase/poly-beta-1,6-N-acetylglucosamine synthase-like glycosyltransferase
MLMSVTAPVGALKPAASSSIAQAARAHGDAYPPLRGQWRIRGAGLLLLATTVLYAPWMLTSLNHNAAWLAWPFAVANVFSLAYGVLAVCNAWSRSIPEPCPLGRGSEPHVAVIIPTCGEPLAMVLRTITSVLDQDWPADRLTVVISDDGHNRALEHAVASLPVLYHSPPHRYAAGRDGSAKAGNLNSAVAMLDIEHPHIPYIETRDADDEVGSNRFLRHVVGQLEAEPGVVFVQTVKQAQVSAGDPFNNWESMFYRGQMLARNASNAVFPCGSGLVWRRTALRAIGDFPTWNLVEDVQSGLEVLRHAWRGMYLPIVGAVGQHAPEDVRSFYKQRGTWAIDTVRLVVWCRLKGLTLRQRAQFWEMLAFYLNAFTAFVYIPSIVCSLLGWTPLVASGMAYVIHLVPLVVAIEVWLLVLNLPYGDRRSRQRKLIRKLWQTRVMWTGMAPVYARAVVLAIIGGPNRKPVYAVTRKEDDFRWHWRHTLPQTTIVLLILSVMVYELRYGTFPSIALLAGSVYWGGLNIMLLASFISRGWYGIERVQRVARRMVAAAILAAAGTAMTIVLSATSPVLPQSTHVATDVGQTRPHGSSAAQPAALKPPGQFQAAPFSTGARGSVFNRP